MVLRDREVDELHELKKKEIEKETQKEKNDPIKRIPDNVKWPFAAAVVLILYFAVTKQWTVQKSGLWIAGIIAVVWFVTQGDTVRGFLNWDECISILKTEIIKRQRTMLLPEGEILIQGRTKEFLVEQKPVSRYIGFTIINRQRRKLFFYVEMNIKKSDRPGDIMQMCETQTMFDPDDVKPVRYIPDMDLQKRMRYEGEIERSKG